MRRTSDAAVVLFCGDVRREERQKNLPPRFLAALHDWLARTVVANADADLLVATRAGARLVVRGADDCQWSASSLEEQIETVLGWCFSAGYRRVILLAGDIPASPVGALSDAFRVLESPDRRAVLGRSGDGGFYLAGFNAPPDIDWKTVLFDRTRAGDELTASLLGSCHVTELTPLDDIDSRGDALRLLRYSTIPIASALVSLLRRQPLPAGEAPPPRAHWHESPSPRGPPSRRCA